MCIDLIYPYTVHLTITPPENLRKVPLRIKSPRNLTVEGWALD